MGMCMCLCRCTEPHIRIEPCLIRDESWVRDPSDPGRWQRVAHLQCTPAHPLAHLPLLRTHSFARPLIHLLARLLANASTGSFAPFPRPLRFDHHVHVHACARARVLHVLVHGFVLGYAYGYAYGHVYVYVYVYVYGVTCACAHMGVCTAGRMSMCTGTCMGVCAHAGIGTCMGMLMEMCADMCMGMQTGMCRIAAWASVCICRCVWV